MQGHLKELQQIAPSLWVCHVQQKRRLVLTKGVAKKVKAVLGLIKITEKQTLEKKENVTVKRRGQRVLSDKVPIVDEEGNTMTKE